MRKDTNESPTSETDTEVKQSESVTSSSAVDGDGDVDESDIAVLPGTGGPDDSGDVEVDPAELNL